MRGRRDPRTWVGPRPLPRSVPPSMARSLEGTSSSSQPGRVFLVGAGPGDPELLTVRAWRCLQRADVVLYDRLLDPRILDEVALGAERLFVGKGPGRPGIGQEAIHRLLIDRARRGLRVVRLKGGDPYVFGRGGEEGIALDAAGVDWKVVPGISSALAVPALAGIPLTHRGVARSFSVVTAHRAGQDGAPDPTDWDALARLDTLVVLMGVASLPWIVEQLLRHRAAETPVAMVERGTLPDERRLLTRLGDVVAQAAMAGIASPAILVVGEVVRLAPVLAGALESDSEEPEVSARWLHGPDGDSLEGDPFWPEEAQRKAV